MLEYFNPRSHERSDNSYYTIIITIINFNPRSHERSDASGQKAIIFSNWISIHAPTRGATRFAELTSSATLYFNPRSHERSDLYACIFIFVISKFQSTLPREERLMRSVTQKCINCISIHAPTRGATKQQPLLSFSLVYFNPRSHERSDRCIFVKYISYI